MARMPRSWRRKAHPRRSRGCSAAAQRDPRVDLAAAARRLPRADQPAVVHPRAARQDREHRRRRRPTPRRSLIRPGYQWEGHDAGPVPAHRAGHQRPPPLARLLAHLRPRAARRLHLDHGQERRRGHRLAVPRAARAAGQHRLARRRRGRLRAPRRAARASCCSSAPGSGITPIMSMLRSLEHRDALGDVVLLHSARDAGRRHLRRRAARAGVQADDGFTLHEQLHEARSGRFAPADLDAAVPGLARARGVRLRARRDARRARRALGGRGRLRPPAHGALPAEDRRRPRRARAARSSSSRATARPSATARKPILVAGEEAGLELPVRLPRGHLPHVRRRAARGRGPRPAHRARCPAAQGETVRTCINAPEGPVEIEL